MSLVSVVGGSGFIGTRLCRLLASRGMPFEIVDIKPSQTFPEATKIADIRDASDLRGAMTGDVVVHLAAVHRDDVQDKTLYSETNIEGTRNICNLANEIGVKKIVFTSSVAVYGFAPEGTDEHGLIKPFHEYGRTKFEAEEILRSWRETDPGKSLIIVRPTVVFGEGNRGNVYNLLSQIASGRFVMVGPGKNLKSMAYVGNVAAFLDHAIKAERQYGLFNYVDGPDYDMRTLVMETRKSLGRSPSPPLCLPASVGFALGYLADAISQLSGHKLPISSLRIKKFCSTTSFATSKAELANFQAPISLEEGLQRTVEAEFIAPDSNEPVFFTE